MDVRCSVSTGANRGKREEIMGGVAEFEPGDIFAERYEIQRMLGEGNRKRTYLARDTKMGRFVALSLVKPEAVPLDPDGTVREAKVLGRIGRNDNIVSIYEYDIDDSIQYMVFEYLGGGTLAEHLREVGQLSPNDVLRIGRQLGRGLAHLHKRGLIHRDVSPHNVWLDERHEAHLGDFDSAIPATDMGGRPPVTTNLFSAPEERDGRSLDVRSDLYSLGGVLYVAATGADRPGDPKLLSSERPDLPSAFEDLVASLLSESPDDRPPDAETVLRLLNEVRHSSNIDTLIATGEGETIEFKSSLHHPYEALPPDVKKKIELGRLSEAQAQKDVQKELKKTVTKTIAAFLNTSGGTLLIGVNDSGMTVGIEASRLIFHI
jgi:serine/threonine protein kinase